jgi:hypothetical protein
MTAEVCTSGVAAAVAAAAAGAGRLMLVEGPAAAAAFATAGVVVVAGVGRLMLVAGPAPEDSAGTLADAVSALTAALAPSHEMLVRGPPHEMRPPMCASKAACLRGSAPAPGGAGGLGASGLTTRLWIWGGARRQYIYIRQACISNTFPRLYNLALRCHVMKGHCPVSECLAHDRGFKGIEAQPLSQLLVYLPVELSFKVCIERLHQPGTG